MDRPTFEETRGRIEEEAAHHGGAMPERTALAWYGYLAALIEWGLISPHDHGRLVDLLPPLDDNPATDILLGRE